MTEFRFIHTSDLHLGRRFSHLPEEVRGRLQEARHGAIARLAAAARAHCAAHVLVAGDVFDSETPSDPVRRQALTAMAADPAIRWLLLPGNHDSLAAEALWDRVAVEAPPNVSVLAEAAPLPLAPGVALLPAPLTRRYPGRDLTEWMDRAETPEGAIRLGLAHGAIYDFGEDGGADVLAPTRATTARLDYLALGDWHGRREIDAHTWYSGAPERDRFRHPGRGECLAVTLAGSGAPPVVAPVVTGVFDWSDAVLQLLPGQDAAEALAVMLPPPAARRDALVRLRATGRATLPQRDALARAAAAAAPDFGHFALDDAGLRTEIAAADLDEIDRGGALRLAADRLRDAALDDTLTGAERDVAQAALSRLYGFLKEDER